MLCLWMSNQAQARTVRCSRRVKRANAHHMLHRMCPMPFRWGQPPPGRKVVASNRRQLRGGGQALITRNPPSYMMAMHGLGGLGSRAAALSSKLEYQLLQSFQVSTLGFSQLEEPATLTSIIPVHLFRNPSYHHGFFAWL